MEDHVETCPVLIEEIAEHSVTAGEVLGARCVARGPRNGVDREPANGGPRRDAQRVPSPNMAPSGVEAWHSKDMVNSPGARIPVRPNLRARGVRHDRSWLGRMVGHTGV